MSADRQAVSRVSCPRLTVLTVLMVISALFLIELAFPFMPGKGGVDSFRP